jgi:hypothetical protein
MNTSSDDANSRSCRARTVLLQCGLLVAPLALAVTGCGGDNPEQFNQSASISSIGPLSFDGTSLNVEYTLRDAEGDDQSLYVSVCDGEEPSEDLCPQPVEGAPSDGLTAIPTVPNGEDVSHQFAWNVGCGRVSSGTCEATDIDQSYVVRIRLDGSDQTAVSESFTLRETFGVGELPECDESAVSVPNPCPPNSSDSS